MFDVRLLFLVSCLWLLVSPARAIVDTNTNGVSDLWEQQFNGGQLFDNNFDPQTDPDGDGWTNAHEAAAGTDPFDANPPGGFLRPEITRTPAVWGDTDDDGIDEIITPEVLHVTWTGLPGKQYTLLVSTDLSAGSWLPVDEPHIATGGEIRYCFPLAVPEPSEAPEGGEPGSGDPLDGAAGGVSVDSHFWRVAVTDTDTDGDTLTDAEENELGSSPDSADGDGDDLSDLDELFVHHTLPMSRDSDGDGVGDWDEIMVNLTNPLSNLDDDSDGLADDWEKWWAAQILASGIELTTSQRDELLAGNVDPAAAAFGDGTTNAEQFEVSQQIAAVGGSVSPYRIRRKERAVWGTLTAHESGNYGGIPGLLNGEVRWIGSASEEPYFPPADWVAPSAPQIDIELATRTPWPAALWEDYPFMDTESHLQQNTDDNGYTYTEFSASHHMFKLIYPTISNESRTANFVKVTTKWGYPVAGEPVQTCEMVQLTVPPNRTTSQEVEIKPTLELGAETEISHAPIEVRGFLVKEIDESIGVVGGTTVKEMRRQLIQDSEDPTGFRTEPRSELKISQWDDVFDYLHAQWQFSDSEFKKNSDVFRVRMDTPPPPTGKHKFKVWTTDASGAVVDSGAEIELDQYGSFLQSSDLCLVADETDDAHPVDGKVDGALNDHTYRAELGGQVKFQWLTAPGTGGKPIISMPVPVKKVVTAHGYILQQGSTFPSPVASVADANAYFERAKTMLATCGVKLDYSVSVIDPNPGGVDFGSGVVSTSKFNPPHWAVDHVEMDPESKSLMSDVRCKPANDAIPVYFVGYFNGGGNGATTVQSAMLPADIVYANAVFLDSIVVTGSTLAHEFMHVLLDAVHDG